MKKNYLSALILFQLISSSCIFAQGLPVKTAVTSVTLGYLSKFSTLPWSGYDLINNSLIYDDGTNIGIGTQTPVSLLNIRNTKIASYSSTALPTPTIRIDNVTNSQSTPLQYSSLGFNICSQTSGNNSYGTITLLQPTYQTRASTFTFTLRNSSGNYIEIMRMQSDGTIGIGTTSPSSKLHVVGNSVFTATTNSITSSALIRWNNEYSSAATPDYTWFNNDQVGIFHPATNNIAFSNGGSESMRIIGNGNVLIGKSSQLNTLYKLDVAGKIRADEIVVNTTGADYVFEDDYQLLSLNKLEKSIKKNKHLPGIPSANEMKNNGMSVGETNTLLLQKIEELTLYLIELNKKNEELQKKMEQLEKSIK